MRSAKRVRGLDSGVPSAGRGAANPKSEIRYSQSKGFTLIEIVITIVLIGILSGIAAMIILQGVRAYSDEQSRSDSHYQARLAIERMAREIRTIKQPGLLGAATPPPVIGAISGNPAASFIFTDASGATITYSLSGTTLNRTVGGIPAALAQNVMTLEFWHYDNTGTPTTAAASVWTVRIDITVTPTSGTETYSLRSTVHPRNF